MADEVEDDGVDEARQELEQEATQLGWVPKEKFKGNPDHWVDAEEYVERGRSVMPIVLENNKRLKRELSTRDQKIGTLETQLQNATKAIEKLEHHYTEANKRAVQTARQQLKEELKAAREDNDLDAELDIQDRIRDLDKSLEEPPPADTDKKDKPQASSVSPALKAWAEDNPWFGTDKKKTKLVTRIAEDLREEGTDLVGREFMDEVVRLYEEQYGGESTNKTPTPKVEGTPTRGARSGGGKTFADLPAEAKKACWDDVEDLVGPGKRYKTKKDWETAYAKIYFTE